MTNTALSAKTEQIARNVAFKDDKHRKFFLTYLQSAGIVMFTMWHWCIT